MATYNSPRVTNKWPIPVHGFRHNVQQVRGIVTCSAAPTTSDTLNFFDIPLNAVIVGGYLKSDQLDTNGSPTIALNIGDAGSAGRLFAGATVSRTGTATTLTGTALGYKYTTKTRVTGTASANAATGAAGNVELCLLYYVDDSTTS